MTLRQIFGWAIILLAFALWIPSSDIIELIVRQREVVLGRYSRGHFGALLVLTLFLLILGGLLASKIKSTGELIGVGVMLYLSTFGSIAILLIASGHFANQARYVEKQAEASDSGIKLSGIVRHRPPNEFYEFVYEDAPDMHRSYPDRPPGYGKVPITLTTDKYGFRNLTDKEQYDIVIVGDSFAAGSHVSDEQSWGHVLSQHLKTDIYNLGVSGSDPGTYLNNFVTLGRQFKPGLVLFVIYEGNDFKKDDPVVFTLTDEKSTKAANKPTTPAKPKPKKKQALLDKWEMLAKRSPITQGLKNFSSNVMEKVCMHCPVPGYQETMGWMPVKVSRNGADKFYSFKPKRLLYLYEDAEPFSRSGEWKRVSSVMEHMNTLAMKDNFELVFLYAPSKPHVVMPLIKDEVPTDQLHRFASYKEDDLPDAELFKQTLYQRIDNIDNLFIQHCYEKNYACLSLTEALQHATDNGVQTYFTYDQHWTPDGNEIVETTVREYLQKANLIQTEK